MMEWLETLLKRVRAFPAPVGTAVDSGAQSSSRPKLQMDAQLFAKAAQTDAQMSAGIEQMGAQMSARIEQTDAQSFAMTEQTGAQMSAMTEQTGARMSAMTEQTGARMSAGAEQSNAQMSAIAEQMDAQSSAITEQTNAQMLAIAEQPDTPEAGLPVRTDKPSESSRLTQRQRTAFADAVPSKPPTAVQEQPPAQSTAVAALPDRARDWAEDDWSASFLGDDTTAGQEKDGAPIIPPQTAGRQAVFSDSSPHLFSSARKTHWSRAAEWTSAPSVAPEDGVPGWEPPAQPTQPALPDAAAVTEALSLLYRRYASDIAAQEGFHG